MDKTIRADIATGNDVKNINDIFTYAEQLDFGELHFFRDEETGLKTIIAIHNTKLGPALGGCRILEYSDTQAALRDAMRLAQGMSYKAAICNIPQGGGKAVILKPKHIHDRDAFFKAFGRCVEKLNGRYITAKDSGTTTRDMDMIATQTRYVTSTSEMEGRGGDPSPYTALGVVRGMEATAQFLWQRDDLAGLHVAIQGLGSVGYDLARRLHEKGVKLTVADINENAVKNAVNEFGASAVSVTDIHKVSCDILSPCALGATLNDITIPELRCQVIAGSANNQLARAEHGDVLRQKNITYVPDFVINAGGLMQASADFNRRSLDAVTADVMKLYDAVMNILQRSKLEQMPTNRVADKIAREILGLE